MRIITTGLRFKDYYDGGMAMGQDESTTYVRERYIAAPDHGIDRFSTRKYFEGGPHGIMIKSEDRSRYRAWWDSRRNATACVLFFCGRAYPFWEATRYVKREGRFAQGEDAVQMTSFDSKNFDPYVDTQTTHHNPVTDFRQWLTDNPSREDASVNLHFNSPVVIYHEVDQDGRMVPGFEVNGCLKDIGFQTMMDPFTAFQEVAMYVSGVLTQTRDAPAPQTDKQKIASHGLHPTHAFRKMKAPK